jgi:hypothetical protein
VCRRGSEYFESSMITQFHANWVLETFPGLSEGPGTCVLSAVRESRSHWGRERELSVGGALRTGPTKNLIIPRQSGAYQLAPARRSALINCNDGLKVRASGGGRDGDNRCEFQTIPALETSVGRYCSPGDAWAVASSCSGGFIILPLRAVSTWRRGGLRAHRGVKSCQTNPRSLPPTGGSKP